MSSSLCVACAKYGRALYTCSVCRPLAVAAAAKRQKIVVCLPDSDVKSLTVAAERKAGAVLLGVNDQDSDDSADGQPLITAQLLPSQAIRLARALLAAAGVDGVTRGNVQTFTFID